MRRFSRFYRRGVGVDFDGIRGGTKDWPTEPKTKPVRLDQDPETGEPTVVPVEEPETHAPDA